MNPRLELTQPYPFEKLAALLDSAGATSTLPSIRLSIGEPQHATPECVREALVGHLEGLAIYPTTSGTLELRCAIALWLRQRYGIELDSASQILPVNGSREALFAFAQCVIDGQQSDARVLCPNPFYQIYEGAALLAGAQPLFVNLTPENGYAMPVAELSAKKLDRVQLLYACSPNNPTGRVITQEEWETLFALADRHDFVIASDECYSEIYPDEDAPPLGALQAAVRAGRTDFRNLVVFSSLSKRSNVPGLRSGFVAGDAEILRKFLRYRTYHGCAMSPTTQAASIAAWRDEAHVIENRRLYREKFAQVIPILSPWLDVSAPDAGFYLWAGVPGCDRAFARDLYAAYNVTILPGSLLARDTPTGNPGQGRVRISLVAEVAQCVEAAERIAQFCQTRQNA